MSEPSDSLYPPVVVEAMISPHIDTSDENAQQKESEEFLSSFLEQITKELVGSQKVIKNRVLSSSRLSNQSKSMKYEIKLEVSLPTSFTSPPTPSPVIPSTPSRHCDQPKITPFL